MVSLQFIGAKFNNLCNIWEVLKKFAENLEVNVDLKPGKMIKRKLYSDLLNWKNSPRCKPLLLQGARQVGKTILVKEFGEKEYNHLVYLNFEQNPNLAGCLRICSTLILSFRT